MVYTRMFVKTNYSAKEYITPGKEYEVVGYYFNEWEGIGSGWIRDDIGNHAFICTGKPCEYLDNDGVWEEIGWKNVDG